MSKRNRAMLAVLVGNGIFGFSFLASKIALRSIDPIALLAFRFTLAFAVLNVFLMLRVIKVRFRGKKFGVLLPMSICQPVIYFLCECYGIQYSTSSFSGLMIALIPVVTFILATVVLREAFHWEKFAWAICSVLGVCIISVTGAGDGSVTGRGVLLLTGAVISGSLYAVLSRKCSVEFTALERTYAMFAAGCVSFLTFSLIQSKGTMISAWVRACSEPTFVAALIYLAVISSVLAFFCMNYAATYLPVTQTSSFANITTLVSIVAGVVFLQETFGIRELVGAVFILCGVYMLNRTAAVRSTDKKQ
ncbi:MAG: DMT family transporter [Lachnospiraceae bacterium]|nr:DMT family transporter [Lachnospiraceae bacterium]